MMIDKRKNLSHVLVYRVFITCISTPVALYTKFALYTPYVKLSSLNGLIKLTNFVNKIKQFTQINSMWTLAFFLNHRLPP